MTLSVGALAFHDLWPLCTVTPRQPRKDDPLYAEAIRPSEQGPQRETDEVRVKAIAEFVRARLDVPESGKKATVFPNAVILGLLADSDLVTEVPERPPATTALLLGAASGHVAEVWLPRVAACLFIIDGQHRLKGLSFLEGSLRKTIGQLQAGAGGQGSGDESELANCRRTLDRLLSLSLPVSLLIDFDLAEQAMVFADVNFNQKSVPRSFFFGIFGAFQSDEVTPISFTHDLVLHLSNSEKSPLRGMVKLPGTGPGLVSQAFLGAKFMFLLDPRYPKSAFRDFFQRRRDGDKEASREFAAIVRNFFDAVHAEMAYAWPVPHDGKFSSYRYEYILCKSMAMGALVAILGDIYRLVLLDFAFGSERQIASAEVFTPPFFRQFLVHFDPRGREQADNSVFGRRSEWGIGGSAVLEKRIYETMRQWVFTAYRGLVGDGGSSYIGLIARFRGARTAADLSNRMNHTDAKSFWGEIDQVLQRRVGGDS